MSRTFIQATKKSENFPVVNASEFCLTSQLQVLVGRSIKVLAPYSRHVPHTSNCTMRTQSFEVSRGTISVHPVVLKNSVAVIANTI